MRIEGIAALCEFFGCSHQAVANWQDEGMPVLQRGGPNVPSVFDSVAVHEWLRDRAVKAVTGPESPRDRLWRIQADREALALANERRQLVAIDEVEPKWAAACVAAREQLLRVRRSLAAQLDGVTERRAREEIIAQVHEAFLRRLAGWRTSSAEGEGEVDA